MNQLNQANDKQMNPSPESHINPMLLLKKQVYFVWPLTMLKSDKRSARCTLIAPSRFRRATIRSNRDLCQVSEPSAICRAEGGVLEIRLAELTQQRNCQSRWPLNVPKEGVEGRRHKLEIKLEGERDDFGGLVRRALWMGVSAGRLRLLVGGDLWGRLKAAQWQRVVAQRARMWDAEGFGYQNLPLLKTRLRAEITMFCPKPIVLG